MAGSGNKTKAVAELAADRGAPVMAPGKRRADLGRLTRLVEMLRESGVSKFTEGDVSIEFAGPGIDYDRLADVLTKDEATRQQRSAGDRPMSEAAREQRRRLPRDAQ